MIKNYPTLKNLVPLFFFLFSFGFISAQYQNSPFIVAGDITSPVCAGSNVTLTFEVKNGNKLAEYYNNSSSYIVEIFINGTATYTNLKTFSTSGVSYCGINNCYTSLQTDITIPSNFSTGDYRIRIYSTSPVNDWYVASNIFRVNSLPVAPSGPISGSRCGTGSVNLSVNNPGVGFTIDWYAASTEGNVLSGGSGTSSFTTPNISSTTTYYAEIRNTSTGCVSAIRTAATATVNAIPTIATTTPNSRCGIGTVVLGATASAGTINWYAAATGGSSLGTGISFTTPSISASTTYYVDATNAGCTTATRTAVIATVNAIPTIATTTPNSRCGTGTVVLGATASAGTINWYADATGGSSLGTGTGFTTPSISSSATYYVDATNGSCTTATRTAVTATINLVPTALTVGTITQSTCAVGTGSVILSGLPSGSWELTRSPGSITTLGTGTSTTISGLAAATYNFIVTNAAGCTSIASANVVINAQPAINTWNGSVSTDWNTDDNWCYGVPSDTNDKDVLIPTIPTGGRFPVLSAFMVLTYPEGYVKNIVFESGSILIIENNALNVAGNMTLNGKIDLNNEAQLLQDTGSTLDLASIGTIEIDQQGTGDSFNYNYWSSPVNSNLAAKTYSIGGVLRDGTDAVPKPIDFGAAHTWADGAATPAFIKLSTYWMYKLENSKGYAAWTRIGNNTSIKVGEGYTMKGSNTAAVEQNYTFEGKPNNGDISLPIAIDNHYLVGNPYPSALDADQFILDNLAHTGPLYFWEHSGGGTHNLAGYQGGYATYTIADGVPASSRGQVAGVGTAANANKVPDRYIPVGQAFFVVGDTIGDIIFNNNQRVFWKESDGYSVFMKSSATKSKTVNTRGADLRPKFRIGFDAPKISHRQVLLTIDERATPLYDRGFEAEIYEVFEDDFYWMLDGKRYVIQATNHTGLNSEVPIGIQLSKTGLVTVKIDALENVDDDTTIYLKDKVTGESFNMREKPVQLNLTAGKYADRFVLVFKTQKLVAEDVKAEILIPAVGQSIIEGIHVLMNNAIGELQIKNNSTEEIVSVALLNSLGQTVKIWNSNFNIRTISWPISTASGIYLVQINTKTGKTVKKISVE